MDGHVPLRSGDNVGGGIDRTHAVRRLHAVRHGREPEEPVLAAPEVGEAAVGSGVDYFAIKTPEIY